MIDEGTLKEVKRRRKEESRLYDNYVAYYRRRELIKASEFLWGSINNLAYAIGLIYGRRLTNHGKIVQFLRELAKESGKGGMKDTSGRRSTFTPTSTMNG
ncbi:TPA: hypothetical protein EYP26_04005 [Candidatus Bathyarchaeota archaeon]|nr:hypothetical protein [Candidatus Bathyarchaeota archaeon]